MCFMLSVYNNRLAEEKKVIGFDAGPLADILCWVFLAGAVLCYLLTRKSPTDSAKDAAEEKRLPDEDAKR